MLTSIDAIRLKDRPVYHDGQFSGSFDKVVRAYRERSHYRGYQIRPVRTPHQHDLASKLVRRMYSGLTNLFQVALEYGKDNFTGSDAVIEVNPRHARYYQQRLGFEKIGNLRQCPRVNAPAVLLHQELDGISIPTGNPRVSVNNGDFYQFAATG